MDIPSDDHIKPPPRFVRHWRQIRAYLRAFRHDVLFRRAWLKIRWWVTVHTVAVGILALLSFIPFLLDFDIFELLSNETVIVTGCFVSCFTPLLLLSILAQAGWQFGRQCWMETYGGDASLKLLPLSHEERLAATMGPIIIGFNIILLPVYLASLVWWSFVAREILAVVSIPEEFRGGESFFILMMITCYLVTHLMILVAVNLLVIIGARRRFLQLDKHPGYSRAWDVNGCIPPFRESEYRKEFLLLRFGGQGWTHSH